MVELQDVSNFDYAKNMLQQDYIKQIQGILSDLYLLTSEEQEKLLKKTGGLPGKTLEKILLVLQEAKQQQDVYLSKKIKLEPDFLEKLKVFLSGNEQTIKAQYKIQKYSA